MDYSCGLGGTPNAAGCSFSPSNTQAILDWSNEHFKNKFLDKYYYYDAKLIYNKMTIEFLDKIDKISRITGFGFEKPKFLLENIRMPWRDKIGEKKNHTKLTRRDDGIYFYIMDFNNKEPLDRFKKAKSVDAVGSVSCNRYYSETKQQWCVSKQMFADIITTNER